MVNGDWGESLSYINFNRYYCCLDRAESHFLSLFATVTLPKAYSDSEQLFVTEDWCNIILKAPWMEREALTAFICKSLTGSVLLMYKSWGVFHSLVCGGKHQICTNGEKKKKKRSRLHAVLFTFWSGANSSFASVSCKCYSTICGK